MAEQGKPRISNFTKFFVPGLAIGLVAGGLGGAYFAPTFEGPTMQENRPKGAAPATRSTGRPTDPPPTQAPAATGPSGATGETGASAGTEAPPK